MGAAVSTGTMALGDRRCVCGRAHAWRHHHPGDSTAHAGARQRADGGGRAWGGRDALRATARDGWRAVRDRALPPGEAIPHARRSPPAAASFV